MSVPSVIKNSGLRHLCSSAPLRQTRASIFGGMPRPPALTLSPHCSVPFGSGCKCLTDWKPFFFAKKDDGPGAFSLSKLHAAQPARLGPHIHVWLSPPAVGLNFAIFFADRPVSQGCSHEQRQGAAGVLAEPGALSRAGSFSCRFLPKKSVVATFRFRLPASLFIFRSRLMSMPSPR